MTKVDHGQNAPRRLHGRRLKVALETVPKVLSTQWVPVRDRAGTAVIWGKYVVIYARYSSDREKQRNGYSIEQQKRVGYEYANDQGWTVLKVFADEGISGATSDRPQFRAMMEFIRTHPGTIVLVATASRLARETEVYDEFKRETKGLHARLIVVAMGDVNGDRIDAEMVHAQRDRHELIVAMRNGKETAILDGLCVTGLSGYGYYLGTDGRAYPETNGTVDIVKRIFDERVKGVKLGTIARNLELDGVKTPEAERHGTKACDWNAEKVRSILKRVAYRGILRQKVKIYPWERQGKLTGQEAKVYNIDAPWMRLVSDEVWFACNPPGHGRSPNKTPSDPYLLTGKLTCPTCGMPLSITHRRGHYLARCKHRRPDVECPELRYDYRILEKLGWEVIASGLGVEADTAFSDQLREAVRASYERERQSWNDRQAEIEALDRELDDAASAARMEGSRFLRRFLSSLEEQEETLAALKAEHNKRPRPLPFEDHWNAVKTDLSKALALLMSQQPFRPGGSEGKELLKIAAACLGDVRFEEREHDRFNVTYRFTGAPWGTQDVAIDRVFRDVIIWDTLGRRDHADKLFASALADRSLMASLISHIELGGLKECKARFGDRAHDVVHVAALGIKFGMPVRRACTKAGFDSAFRKKARIYFRTREARQLQETLAQVLNTPVREFKYSREGHVRTLRERAVLAKNPILRYPVADPSSSETRIPDQDWQALMDAGLAMDFKSLTGRKGKNDRSSLDAVLFVLRENARMDDCPKEYGCVSFLNRMISYLDDHELLGPIMVVLLRKRGIVDIPSIESFPKLRDQVSKFAHRLTADEKKPKQHDIRNGKRQGRRPSMEVRRAASAEHFGKGINA